jgi:hypothetical protein
VLEPGTGRAAYYVVKVDGGCDGLCTAVADAT